MKFDTNINIEKHRAGEYFAKLVSEKANLELKKVKVKRTIKQNSYLHVLFAVWGNEFGYHLHEAKVLIKRTLGYYYTKKGDKFLESTANFDSLKMTQFIDKFRQWSLESTGFYLPTADEYLENRNEIDNEIENYS